MNTKKFELPSPSEYRGWLITLVLVTPENAQPLAERFGGRIWRDNLLRPIGIKIPADRPGEQEFAKHGHYVLVQTRGDMKLTQVINECAAKHMMAQISKRSA